MLDFSNQEHSLQKRKIKQQKISSSVIRGSNLTISFNSLLLLIYFSPHLSIDSWLRKMKAYHEAVQGAEPGTER